MSYFLLYYFLCYFYYTFHYTIIHLYLYRATNHYHTFYCFFFYISTLCPLLLISPYSAGVGRTGTFITLDAMMERLKERDDLNIFEFVNEMRSRRKQMVQTMVSALLYLYVLYYVYTYSCFL